MQSVSGRETIKILVHTSYRAFSHRRPQTTFYPKKGKNRPRSLDETERPLSSPIAYSPLSFYLIFTNHILDKENEKDRCPPQIHITFDDSIRRKLKL